MVRYHIIFLLSVAVAMTLLTTRCGGCTIGLHEGTRANVTDAFARCLSRGNTVVRFHLYLQENFTTKSTFNSNTNSTTNSTMESITNSTTDSIMDDYDEDDEVQYAGQFLVNAKNFTSFRAKANDTFAPYLWVWARANGKYILRVPMDYHVMSLGIISNYITDMDVPIVTDRLNCTEELPYEEVQNMVATLLYEEIVEASKKELTTETYVIGRSAYTAEYFVGRVIGVKGCDRNPTTGNFSCSSLAYMKGWEMTWFGPTFVITFFYIFIFLTFYKEYILFNELRGKDKNLHIKISIIEQKILRDLTRIRRQIYGAPMEKNFIAYLDKANFLDILGVSQKVHRKVILVAQTIVTIVLLGGYYSIMAYSIYYHSLKQQRELLEQIQNSRDVYSNVFSHLAWLYTNPNIGVNTYATFEACYTALIPPIMIFLGVMFQAAKMDVEVRLHNKLGKSGPSGNTNTAFTPTTQNTYIPQPHAQPACIPQPCIPINIHKNELAKKETKQFGVEVRYVSCFHGFANSMVGKALCMFLGCVVIIYWLFIGGVYAIYSLYMIGVGSFLTLNLFAGWMLPACLCIYYSYGVFTPLFEHYTVSKQTVFAEIHQRGYLVKTDEYMLAPASLIENFYYGRSREKVFEGFQRVFVALSLLLMLFLIFIASQYPDFDIRTKNSNLVMGVNIAIILPFLASMMQTGQPISDFEKEMMAVDIKHYVDEWEAENEAMVEAMKLRVQKLQKWTQSKNPPPDKTNDNPDNPSTSPAFPIDTSPSPAFPITTSTSTAFLNNAETSPGFPNSASNYPAFLHITSNSPSMRLKFATTAAATALDINKEGPESTSVSNPPFQKVSFALPVESDNNNGTEETELSPMLPDENKCFETDFSSNKK